MSLEKSFSDYIDQFLPQLKDLHLGHFVDGDTITFYLKDKKTRVTYFVFFFFNNVGHGKDLNCPLELINELEGFFSDNAEPLLLKWFIKTYDIELERVIPTELVKRV